jgi:hypothetical protein
MIMRYFCRIVCFLWLAFSGLPAQAQTKNDSLKQLFRDAKTELQAMLEGRLPMNFSRAVFLHENAYLGGTLNYEAFMQDIRFRAEIAKRIAATRPTQGYKKADSLQVQLQASIFKLLTDTTKIRFAGEQENERTGEEGFILPAHYAWEDFAGQKNWEVMFVSRLMQTNEGNCHSLPYLYKLIADELCVPAWLSSAPHHLYIQGYSQETGLFNTELSSATFPKDSWLMASGYVGKDAIRNRVYLDTLTLKQSISLCLVDLAQGYQRKFEDTGFVLSCLRTAQVAHPKGLSAFLAEIQTLSKIYQMTKQEMDYKRLEILASKVCMLGYQEIPRAEYVRWLANPHQPKSIIEKPNSNESQTEGKFSTSPLPTFELNTLSGGKYAEYSDLTTPRRIGTILYSTKTGKILQFVAPDTVAVPVEVSARFLSVDPLTKSYPELTPYQFASNTPIRAIDLDGLERLDVEGLDTQKRTQKLKISKVILMPTLGENKPGYSDSEIGEISTDVGDIFEKGNKTFYICEPLDGIHRPVYITKDDYEAGGGYALTVSYDVSVRSLRGSYEDLLKMASSPDVDKLYSVAKVEDLDEDVPARAKMSHELTNECQRVVREYGGFEITLNKKYFKSFNKKGEVEYGTKPLGQGQSTAGVIAHEAGFHNMAGWGHPEDPKTIKEKNKAEEYNKKHPKNPIPVPAIRGMYPAKGLGAKAPTKPSVEETKRIIDINYNRIRGAEHSKK